MTVTREALDRLERHWAVAAVTPQNRQRAHAFAREQHARQHVGRQLHLILVEKPGDRDRLERLALAYELAAIEGLDALLHPSTDPASVELRQQAEAGAFRAFEISRGFPLPHDQDARLFHVLHLAALAYCGDRWSDLRRWINEHPEAIDVPSVANVEWDRRVTYRLFDCWVRLLRKNGWDDLDLSGRSYRGCVRTRNGTKARPDAGTMPRPGRWRFVWSPCITGRKPPNCWPYTCSRGNRQRWQPYWTSILKPCWTPLGDSGDSALEAPASVGFTWQREAWWRGPSGG